MAYVPFLSNEGLAIRIIEEEKPNSKSISTDRKKYYENLMTKYEWKGLDTLASSTKNILGRNCRVIFSQLTQELIDAGHTDSAKALVNKCISLFPNRVIPYDEVMVYYIESALQLKEETIALSITRQTLPLLENNPMRQQCIDHLTYFAEFMKSTKLQELLKEYPGK